MEKAAEAAFTLVEVIAGLAVLTLVTTLAVPLLRGPPASVQVVADATRLAAALRVTRAAALAQAQDRTLVISPSARAYVSSASLSGAFSPRTDVSLTVAPQERSASGGGVRFFPSGRSSGGEIHLRVDRAEARVRVNWATGRVEILP